MNPSARPSLGSGTITNEPIPNSRATRSGSARSPPGSATKIGVPVASARSNALKCSIGNAAGSKWENWKNHLHYLDYAVLAGLVLLVVFLVLRRRRRAAPAT